MAPRALTTLHLSLLVLALGLMVAILYQWVGQGASTAYVVLRLVLVVLGLLVLLKVTMRPGPERPKSTCPRCGRRLFETLRTSDRRMVLTCFSCGTEVVPQRGKSTTEEPGATTVATVDIMAPRRREPVEKPPLDE